MVPSSFFCENINTISFVTLHKMLIFEYRKLIFKTVTMEKPRNYRNNNASETIYINNEFGKPLVQAPFKVKNGVMVHAKRNADNTAWIWD